MSFVGAVAAPVRQVLASYAASIALPVLVCGAGNFTVPSVLRSGGYAGAIKACDVSLYTTALGSYLTGARLDVRERADCPAHLRGLLRTGSPLDLAASIALLLDLREAWRVRNPFQARVVDLHRERWEQLLAETRARLEAFRAHLGPLDFAPRDGFDFLQEHGPGHAVFAFPPTYKRGYEKLEALFGAVLEWTPPQYREMTDGSLELYELVAGFESYFVVLEKDIPEARAILGEPVAVLPRGRGTRTYILARSAPRKIVMRKVAKSQAVGPIRAADKTLSGTERLGLAPLTLAQTIRLNELFLSPRIDYFTGGVGLSLAFTLDGEIFGKADFAPSAHQWKLPEAGAMIYLMSDLAVSSRIPRLSKLVLLCLLSREVKSLMDGRWLEDFAWVITTAFASGPVSMKYRGVFDLHTRKPQEGGFALNYYARCGRFGLAEAYEIWLKKYAK